MNDIKIFWKNQISVTIVKLLLLSLTNHSFTIPHYYCTAADSNYYPKLLNLIGSIHASDYENLAEIAVFDLGFTEIQKTNLTSIEKVKLYQVELVHHDLLKYFKTSSNGRTVRGWYAWKPVVIKQALDLFPYVLYIDAGAVILKPLDDLFKHIEQQGYFLMTCGPHTIADTITKNIRERVLPNLSKSIDILNLTQQTNLTNLSYEQLSPAHPVFAEASPGTARVDRVSCTAQKATREGMLRVQTCLTKILAPDSFKISAGLQGLSRDPKVYNNYVIPMYQHARELDLFADDGTSKNGFGSGRHDQPLFSIYAYLNNLTINSEGVSHIIADGVDQQIHIHWHPDCISDQHTAIFQCRNRAGKYSNLINKIKYKSANN